MIDEQRTTRELCKRISELEAQLDAARQDFKLSDARRICAEVLLTASEPGKWREAQRLAKSNERTDENRLLPYWERVRLLYLELGGEFIDRRRA